MDKRYVKQRLFFFNKKQVTNSNKHLTKCVSLMKSTHTHTHIQMHHYHTHTYAGFMAKTTANVLAVQFIPTTNGITSTKTTFNNDLICSSFEFKKA